MSVEAIGESEGLSPGEHLIQLDETIQRELAAVSLRLAEAYKDHASLIDLSIRTKAALREMDIDPAILPHRIEQAPVEGNRRLFLVTDSE